MSESTNDTEQEDDGLRSEDILGLEVFKQRSVGIDIGSSTSHLIFRACRRLPPGLISML